MSKLYCLHRTERAAFYLRWELTGVGSASVIYVSGNASLKFKYSRFDYISFLPLTVALFIPGAESLSPVSTFEKLSHTSSLDWSSISLPCHRADDTEWGKKKPHRNLVLTEQEKEGFCSLSSCVSDTLKITLAGLNYLFNDVMSSHEKDVEGKHNEFLSRNLSGGAERRKNLRDNIRTERGLKLRLPEYEASRTVVRWSCHALNDMQPHLLLTFTIVHTL